MSLEYKKQTDKEHKETLESKIDLALWGQKVASVGDTVKFYVQTHFVGSGSDIEIKVEDKDGKAVTQVAGKVFGDYFANSLTVPEDVRDSLVFTAKLTKHGLEKKSNAMQVIPPFKITNLKWGQKEARRDDIVKLFADIQGVPDGIEVEIRIYEYDQDGAHDFITKFPCRVKNKKIEAQWEYEYHEDTDEIPTDEEMQKYGNNYNPPEYFFVIDCHGMRFGDKQESKLLEFKDWIEIELKDDKGNLIGSRDYILHLSDGNERRGTLDKNGIAYEKDIPPGKVIIEFINSDEEYYIDNK